MRLTLYHRRTVIDFIQITNDPVLARRCDALGGFRLFVDLECLGKPERQAGRNTFISTHTMADVGTIKRALLQSLLMVRLNPMHGGTLAEVNEALAQGADMLMLPMFTCTGELASFCDMVAGRVPVVALLETAGALDTLPQWVGTPGLSEVYVGLNDLHLSLGMRFMFEPLAQGLLDEVARWTHAQGLRLGFGGIARVGEGLLPGEDVLAEHLRLGSRAVILSRTFYRDGDASSMETAVSRLRQEEKRLSCRDADAVNADQLRIAQTIRGIARPNAPQAQPGGLA